MLIASVLATWIAFFLTMAAPPRSQLLRVSKLILALAFAWLVIEAVNGGALPGDYESSYDY